ncbi:MAG: hypothetical protein E7019_05715 [Alphaproteobacteria bacterium]|nr:hypothetical protein [Alphaproteobacteria bacterium]
MVDNIISSSLLLGTGISVGDKMITLIPQELPEFVKPGMVFRVNSLLNLELINNNNLFRMELQDAAGVKLLVDVKFPENIKQDVLINNIYNYSVKVQVGGSLQLVNSKADVPVMKQNVSTLNESPAIKIDTNKPFVELPSIRAGQVIEKLMNEINFPATYKTHVLKSVEFIDVIPVLKNVGMAVEYDDSVLMPIRDTLRAIMRENIGTEQFARLEKQLVNNIKNIDGNLFPAKYIPQNIQEQLMVFDTPLGKILHNSFIKMPNDVPLQMEIKITDNFLQNEIGIKLKTVVEFLKNTMPQHIEREVRTDDILKTLSKPNEIIKPLVKLIDPIIRNVFYQPIVGDIVAKIPGLKPDLFSNLFSFYKAVQTGKISDWIGEDTYNKIGVLPRGNEILSNAENILSSALRDTPTWKIIEVPFFDGNQVFSWKISVARDRQEEKNKNNHRRGIRFVVDTEFTNLGAFQFDGFSSAKERRLDLIIRTSKEQSNDFCSQIINLFKKCLYDVDYVGTIKINLKTDFIKIESENKFSREGVYI